MGFTQLFRDFKYCLFCSYYSCWFNSFLIILFFNQLLTCALPWLCSLVFFHPRNSPLHSLSAWNILSKPSNPPQLFHLLCSCPGLPYLVPFTSAGRFCINFVTMHCNYFYSTLSALWEQGDLSLHHPCLIYSKYTINVSWIEWGTRHKGIKTL